jgi:hypothetical protein
VLNAIAISKVVQCSNKGGAIVCHYLFNGSLAAQDISKDEGYKGLASLSVESASFGPGSQEAASLDDIVIARHTRHEHGINLSLIE